MGTGSFPIGELALATNTKVVTIRYYERVGLLPEPPRTDGNYRAYGPPHLARLSFIRRARDLGFSLDQIRMLLSLADDRSQSCKEVDRLARSQLHEVERKIDDLTLLRDELRQMIGKCANNTISDCRILEALGPQRVRHTVTTP
jgi:Cu(I)-responsive transcriptional regulator